MAGKIEQTEQALTDSVTQAEQALTALGGVVEGEEGAGGLPEGWVMPIWDEITAGDGFRRGPFGGNLKKSNFVSEGYAVYEQYAPINDDCTQFRYFVTEEKYKELSSFWVNEGDYLVSCSGTMGRITQVPKGAPVGVINQALLRIRLDAKLISDSYFIKLFRSPVIKNQVLNKTVGGAIQNLAAVKELKLIEIPLPPLAEQTVIAQTLDTLLAQVDNIKTRLDAIPNILKTFRQSVLAAAVSGKLTEAWRGSDSIDFNQSPITIGVETDCAPKGWGWKKLSDIATLESGHTPRKSVPEYWEGGNVPWISLQDIRAAHGTIINKTKHMPTQLGIDNSSARLLPKGTVCFSRDISVGYTTIMGDEMSTTQHFANWVCGKDLNNKYLMYSLMAAKQHLLLSGQGTTVKTIYMPALKEFQIVLPELKEQTEIVQHVEELFAFADQIEQQVKNAQGRVNNLTQSILAKAFRGELTAQWRAENPDLISGENSAEALLAKIQEEREALKKSAKPKKAPKKKATAKKAVEK